MDSGPREPLGATEIPLGRRCITAVIERSSCRLYSTAMSEGSRYL